MIMTFRSSRSVRAASDQSTGRFYWDLLLASVLLTVGGLAVLALLAGAAPLMAIGTTNSLPVN